MTTQQPEGTAEKAQQVGRTAKEEGRQFADTAAEEARSVGATAQDQAGRVAEEAIDQAGDLIRSTAAHLEEQAEEQAHKVAGALRSASEQAHALAEGRPEEAGDVDRYVRQIAGTLGQMAERIDRLGARGSLEELQGFARRRPGAFLAGAAAAGLLSSRFLRHSGGDGSGTGQQGASAQIPSSTTPVSGPATARPVPPPAPPATSGTPGAADAPPTLQNTGGPTSAPTERPRTDPGPGVR